MQAALWFSWMFVSVPGIATSQMNVHAVVQYNGYTGGRMLLIVNASLTKEMVTSCALVVRNDMLNVTAMVSVRGVMT